MKIAMVALGCAKNVINSEQMLFLLDEAGIEIVSSPELADVTVVNTCGFIQSAKQEAIDIILELTDLNTKIIVAGCLAERYRDEIFTELPEVAGLVGCGSFESIVSAAECVFNGGTVSDFGPLSAADISAARMLTSPPYTAYLKIAEGCDNRCSYCVIPQLRGEYRSRTMEDVLTEARILVQEGAKELILVAQDTSRYGLDIYGNRRLPELLNELCEIEGIRWLRLHYLYPDEIDKQLIEVIANQPKIVKYLDIPIQHCNDRILSAMNRRSSKSLLESLFNELRGTIEGLVLRTSIIVGFPGETEEEFDELCDFLKNMKIERAGVFEYSQEEGTPAGDMSGQIDERTKQKRAEIVREIQSGIMDQYNESCQGRILEVVNEGYDRYAGCYFGRSYCDSPEVDGKVFFTSKRNIGVGTWVRVKISSTIDGDLFGKIRE